MSFLKVPYLNPIKYHKLTPDDIPAYMSRHFEKYRFATTIKEWIEQVDYGQLFQKTDRIWQQFTSDIIIEPDAAFLHLLNEAGDIAYNTSFTPVLENADNPGEFVYENNTNLPDVDLADGVYYARITMDETVLISEPLCICETIPDSLLLAYHHREFKGDVFFETGFSPQMRVLGSLNYKSPASKDTLYEDQELDETLLHSDEYDVWQLVVGGSWGIPDYLIKRLNRVFGCSHKYIDGIRYEKNEGAKFELKEIEGYPLKGVSIELREAVQTASQQYEQ